MEKYLVNTYGNHWVECDSAESVAQEVIGRVDDYYWDDYLLDWEYREIVYSLERMVDGDEEEYFGVTIRYEEVCDDKEEEEDE